MNDRKQPHTVWPPEPTTPKLAPSAVEPNTLGIKLLFLPGFGVGFLIYAMNWLVWLHMITDCNGFIQPWFRSPGMLWLSFLLPNVGPVLLFYFRREKGCLFLAYGCLVGSLVACAIFVHKLAGWYPHAHRVI